MTLFSKTAIPFFAAFLIAWVSQVSSAAAQGTPDVDPSPILGEDPWTFELAPYGWFLGLSGGMGATGGPTVDVDLDFSDIWKNMDWGRFPVYFALKGEARKGKFGLYVDIFHTSLKFSGSTGGPIFDDADLRMKLDMDTIAASYRAAEDSGSYLDIMAGARYWKIDLDIDLKSDRVPDRSADGSASWWDPVVGLKGRYGLSNSFDISDKWFVEGTGWYGGFDTGSKKLWDLYAGVKYELNDRVDLGGGWRYMIVDYSGDGLTLDNVEFSGPLLEAVFTF